MLKLTKSDQIMIVINCTVGFWWALAYTYIFQMLRNGGAINEPSTWIANTEFALAVILCAWFIFQMIYWLSKIRI